MPIETDRGHPLPRTEDGNHDCRQWLEYRCKPSTEPHGETFFDEWFECVRCKSKWTERDLEMTDAA